MEAIAGEFEASEWDPFLVPAWRHEDAQRLAAGEQPKWSANDPAIVDCAAYLGAVADAHDEQKQAAVRHQWPWLAAAHAIAEQDDPRRWEVEARLLTGQTDADIGARCGLPPDVVKCYETVFFSVRSRLGARMWVCNQVIGDGPRRGFRDDELGLLWAAFGYHGGVPVLDALVNAFYATWRPTEPATIEIYFRDECPASLKMKAVIAAYSVPSNVRTAMKFTTLHRRLQKIERKMRRGKAAAPTDAMKRETIRLWQSSRPKMRDIGVPAREGKLVDEAMTGSEQVQPPVEANSVPVPANPNL